MEGGRGGGQRLQLVSGGAATATYLKCSEVPCAAFCHFVGFLLRGPTKVRYMQVFRDTRYKVEEDRRHKMLIETVPLSSQQCNAFLGYFLGISWVFLGQT